MSLEVLAKKIAECEKRLVRAEYELTEVRFRCKALECKQNPMKYNQGEEKI